MLFRVWSNSLLNALEEVSDFWSSIFSSASDKTYGLYFLSDSKRFLYFFSFSEEYISLAVEFLSLFQSRKKKIRFFLIKETFSLVD